MFKKLLELKQNGTLDIMVKCTLITPKVYMYLEMYMYINAKLTVNKTLNKTQAVADCAEIFNTSIPSVWRALYIMETTIEQGDTILLKH